MSLSFDRNERISIDGYIWKVERRTPDGHCLVSEMNGRVKALSDKKLLKHWTEGRLARHCPTKSAGAPADRSRALTASKGDRDVALQRDAVLAKLRKEFGPAPYANQQLVAFITLWKTSGQTPTPISLVD